LLESDKHLFGVVVVELLNAQQALTEITSTVQLLDSCRKQITSLSPIPLSSLYLRALDGELVDSATVRELFLAVKKAPSDLLSHLFSVITPFVTSSARKPLDNLRQQLKDLLKTMDGAKGALRSQHDMRNDTLRTTLVAHKVQLSKHKATISEDDATYSKIVDQFYDWLKEYVDQNLKFTDNVLFAEIFMYDIRGPDKAAFMPKHRFAVERALSSPHDYLNCECCKSNRGQNEDQQVNKFFKREAHIKLTAVQAALAGSQPMTALLYQLYLESGSSINVADLWSAFRAMIGDGEAVEDQQTVYVLVQ
jgi:origin recognition complex subunit 3